MKKIFDINRIHLLKIVTVSFLITILNMLLPSTLSAEVKSKCSNCHSLHDSQDGESVTGTGPQSILMNLDEGTRCWGCHAQGNTDNIDPVTGAPQISHTNGTDLAGGNFAYITGVKSGLTGDTMTRGHNIVDTGVIDNNFNKGIYPPGDEFSQQNEGFNNITFTCAGKFGCHGDRNINDETMAVKGAHHADDSVLKFGSINESFQGGSVGTSYRFLLGVKGGEDSDWEASVSGIDHNEYKGAASGTEGTKVLPGGNTISGLCAECHGNFHGEADDTGSSSLWKRHPADISLPGAGTEYAAYTTYNIQVPVARTIIPNSAGNTVDPAGTTDDIVMCLSCHRAHASPYADMLRWKYEDMVAGGGGTGGCFTCHTSKS